MLYYHLTPCKISPIADIQLNPSWDLQDPNIILAHILSYVTATAELGYIPSLDKSCVD